MPKAAGMIPPYYWQDGIRFYHGNEMVWLADAIPAQYLTIRGD